MLEDKTDDGNLQLAVIPDEEREEELTPLEYDISVFPADFTLEVLNQKWHNKEIVIPKFQRGYVWKLKQASRLIESFMMGLPIPPVFFYIGSDQKYLVIDGRQRLETIFYFFEGLFGPADDSGRRKVFKLDGINPESRWYHKKFSEFEEADQRKLKNTVLRAIVVRQLHPVEEDTSVYHIFERLNTGGTILKDQEVRNCVYSGRFNDLLLELNEYPTWRQILGHKKPDPRQKDVQLILRCLALHEKADEYQVPMKDFLSKYMSAYRNPTTSFLREKEGLFKNTCDAIVKNLGERPLNPKTPLNSAVLDSVFVAFMKHHSSCPADIGSRFEKLFASPEFREFTAHSTSDPSAVHSRLELAERMLFE